MRTLLKEDMEVSHSQTTHLDLFSLPPPWNLELGGFPKQQSITQLFPLLTSIVRMDQPWTLLLPFEVNALRSRPLSWLQYIPEPPSVIPPKLGRRARLRGHLRRILGRPYRYREAPTVTLYHWFVKDLENFARATDYQRIRDHWQSLILGITNRQSPSQRSTTPLERGHIAESSAMFARILFYQLAGEGIAAEEKAIRELKRLVSLERPGILPALPWRDCFVEIANRQPDITALELMKDVLDFGERCHFVHVGRYREDYETDPTLSREEGRRRAVLRDPWQLITQRKWTELAERFEVDIRWLGRARRFRTDEEERLNQLTINQLEFYRDTIFDQIEMDGPDDQFPFLSVTVNRMWLAPIQEDFTMTRIVVPEW